VCAFLAWIEAGVVGGPCRRKTRACRSDKKVAGGVCTTVLPPCSAEGHLEATQRSDTRIIHSSIDVKFWAEAPPSCSAVRPASCPGCGAASREPGRALRIVGHGVRGRDLEGPVEPGQVPVSTTILARRYRCLECGAVVVVVPRGMSRALRYTLDAIGYALALWGYARATAEQSRRAVSTAKARGFSGPEQWSSLRRWASGATRIFGARAPSRDGTLRERAGRVAAWLAAQAPLPTGAVPCDAFFGGRFVHAR
jgi:hypothetical protein